MQRYRIWGFPHWVAVLLRSGISSLCPHSSLSYGIRRYILWHYMLKVYNLFFSLMVESQVRNFLGNISSDFELLNNAAAVERL